MTLAVAILIGVIAIRVSVDAGLPTAVAERVRLQVLWWGFGAVVLSALVGAVLSRMIGEPIRQLTDELRASSFRNFDFKSDGRAFPELNQLRGTIRELALAVRRREDDLAASERKFREVFELVSVGITQVDTAGRFILVNRHFCDMLGYSREELIGRRFVDITHPDERETDETLLQRALKPGAEILIGRDKRYVRKDGSVLWARRSGLVVRDENGVPVYGLGSIEDISSYRDTQEKLQSLNESLNAVVQTSPLAIYTVSPQGSVTLWNPAAESVFGVVAADVVGKPSPLMSSSAQQISAQRERALRGEIVRDIELSWTRPDGGKRELSVSIAPLRATAGQVAGILVTCTDISSLKQTSRALDQQLNFNKELLEVIPAPIFYRRANGPYLGFNRAWEEFFGKRRDDWIGKFPHDLISPEYLDQAMQEDAELLETGKPVIAQMTVEDGAGATRHVVRHVSRFTDVDGNPAGIIGVLTDITEAKEVSRALEASEARFKALTESAMDIVTVLDETGAIRYQSPSVRHLLGYEPADMLGRNQFDLVHPEDAEILRASFADLVRRGDLRLAAEFRVRNAAGEWRTLESVGKNCLGIPAVMGIIVNTRDITDRKQFEERVRHLAYHDALTGLPNRLLMQDRIAQAIARAERTSGSCAVMFIDIDNFKNINDTLGHDAGDELLRQVASRLSAAVRAHDTIARQGGDEFIVLLDQLDSHRGANRVAQKILDALRAAFEMLGGEQHVSGSIGIALFPTDGRDAATLLKNADTAMFHGKALGKNTYQFFTPQMNIAVKRRAALESSLRAAVKNSDFAVVYQPQIDLNSGEIVGFEALVRWVSEEGGTVMPGEFIPLAEETGLINDIGKWVLREACLQAVAWQRAGYPARRMAINLSARQLADKGFLDTLNAILQETGLDPHYLELEVTETQVMRQGEGSVMLLHDIANMGIHLAVDDFGTGYSSLSYLKRLPISKLKIDQTFVRDITVDPNDTAIVVAIINMAKSLDLDIIAEGIETAGQLALLRAKGCTVGQGYYFSVPASAEDLAPLLGKTSMMPDALVAAI